MKRLESSRDTTGLKEQQGAVRRNLGSETDKAGCGFQRYTHC